MSFVPTDGKSATCTGCGKTAYPSERISACGGFWHKQCLKCSTCSIVLNLKTLESFDNKPFCKTHKPSASHTQVASIVQKNAQSAPKPTKVLGVRKDERMTFAPGQAQPIRPGGGAPPAAGGAPRAAPGKAPAKSGPAPVAAKSKAPSLGLSAPKISSGGGDICPGCGKKVFPTERLQACAASWHKQCLKCTECSMTLNLKTVESFQNKPYCKTHKPNPKHTQITDSVSSVQAKNAPKAVRAVQGIKKDTRMTFAPGSMQPVTSADVVNAGGVDDREAQQKHAPTHLKYTPPEPVAYTPSYSGSSSSHDTGGYGGHQESHDQGGYDQGGYEEPQDQGGYDQGGYEEPQDQGGYDQGGYEEQQDQGGYDQGGYEDQGGYDQGGYEDQGGYDQGGYDQGGYEDQGQQDEEDWG